jgi:hypothetical protein
MIVLITPGGAVSQAADEIAFPRHGGDARQLDADHR